MNIEAHTFDRRRHTRRDLEKACKVFHPPTRRFAAASTLNLSASGALLAIDSARPLSPGEPLDLMISWDGGPVLASDGRVRCRIVRVALVEPRRQAVAVEFAQELAEPVPVAAAA